MACQAALRIRADVGPVFLLDAFRQDHTVVGANGAAFRFGFSVQRVVVARVALVFVRHEHHDVGEVGDQQGEQQGEGHHGGRETAAKGDAAQNARIVRSARCAMCADGAHASRAVFHFGIDARALVAAAQQQSDADEACQKRGAALTDEGKRETGQGDEAGYAADDDEGLQHDGYGNADCDKRAHVAFRARRCCEAAYGKAQEQQQHGRTAQKAGFFGDGGEDEVGLHDGDIFSKAVAHANAQHTAVGQRIDGLAELVTRVHGIGEGVEPSVHANLNVAKRCIEDDAAEGRQAKAHDEEHLLAACDVEHSEEEHEAHKRAAEVFLEHGDGERDAPHDEQRSERCGVGQVEAAYAHGEYRKHLAVLRQIGR